MHYFSATSAVHVLDLADVILDCKTCNTGLQQGFGDANWMLN